MPRSYLISSRGAVPNRYKENTGSFSGQELNEWMTVDVRTAATNVRSLRGNYTCTAPSIPEVNGSDLTVRDGLSISGVVYPVTHGGVITKTLPQTADIFVSDVIVPSISVGTYTYQSYQKFAGVHTIPYGFPINEGGYNEFGNGLTDRSQSLTWPSPTRIENGVVSPILGLIGEVSRPCAWGIVSNSIFSEGDADSTFSYRGGLQRGLNSANIPFVNNGGASGAVSFLTSAPAISQQAKNNILKSGYLTHVSIDCMNADLINGQTAAQIITNLLNFKALLAPSGTKLVVNTIPPLTNAANTAKNPGHPTNIWAERTTLNTYIRTNGGVGHGFIDIAAMTEAGTTSLWRTDLGTPTVDGVHPEKVIHDALVPYVAEKAPIISGIWTR